jgi:acyl-CoA thioesterase-2
VAVNPVLAEILRLLDVEKIEENLYRGPNDPGIPHVFGGQVLAQGIATAYRTLADDRRLHSMHAYFLRAGDWNTPVLYDVDRIRDGRSFTTRRIMAIQHGRPILNMSSSWQREEAGLEHAVAPPDVPDPESLTPDRERYARIAEKHPNVERFAFRFQAIDSRQCEGVLMLDNRVREAAKNTWMRAADALPDEPEVHLCLLAYMSDMDFMSTALMPHGVSPAAGDAIQGASLDHALWFHRPFRADDWLLFVKDSPSAAGARGFVRASIYDRGGRLVASAMQECLIRPRPGRRGD